MIRPPPPEPIIPAAHAFDIKTVPVNEAARTQDPDRVQEYALYVGGQLAGREVVYPNGAVKHYLRREEQPLTPFLVIVISTIILFLLIFFLK